MGPSIFIVQIVHGRVVSSVRVCEQCYGLVKVFIEYCHELTLSYGNKLFLKNPPVVWLHLLPVYSPDVPLGRTWSCLSCLMLLDFLV